MEDTKEDKQKNTKELTRVRHAIESRLDEESLIRKLEKLDTEIKTNIGVYRGHLKQSEEARGRSNKEKLLSKADVVDKQIDVLCKNYLDLETQLESITPRKPDFQTT